MILKDSLHEEENNEKEAICDEKGKQERNSPNIVVLETWVNERKQDHLKIQLSY